MGVAAAPGHVIAGRYRVDRLLGRGGMGSVWAATHLVTHKSVALKLIDDSGGELALRTPGGDPRTPGRSNTRRRFVREARAASAVAHPNIVGVHDVFEDEDGTPVMVMDLLVGEPLDYRLVREGRMSIADAASVLLPVVSAVGSVHARGVVHRDLKPANIFLAEEGGRVVVKVLDFGLAKVSAAEQAIGDSAALTSTGAMMGTPYYMAPEQCAGERQLDHRVDIWAIGVILYECLAGRRPITADNLGQVIKKVLVDGVPPLEDAVPGLPAEIYALVRRMLAREKHDRPDDLREVKAVLERYAGEGVTVPSFGPPAAVIAEPHTPLTPLPDAAPRPAIPSRPSADSRAETSFQSGSGERSHAREERAPVSARLQRGIVGVIVGAAALVGAGLFLYRAGAAGVSGPSGHAETVATIAPMPPAPPVLERSVTMEGPRPPQTPQSELELPIAASPSATPRAQPPVKRRNLSPDPPPAPIATATAVAPPPPSASSAPAPARRGVIRDPRF